MSLNHLQMSIVSIIGLISFLALVVDRYSHHKNLKWLKIESVKIENLLMFMFIGSVIVNGVNGVMNLIWFNL
jgi:hypothetical protein